MTPLQLARFSLGVTGRVPLAVLARHFPAPVEDLSRAVAGKIDCFVRQQALGYYPAIEFFRDRTDIIEPYLMDAFDQVAAASQSLAQQGALAMLQPLFSSVTCNSIITLGYALPRVRPNDSDAQQTLILHLTPNRVKLELTLTLFQKQAPTDSLAPAVKMMVLHWLTEVLEEMDVIYARLLT